MPRRPARPENCVLAVALPPDEAAFEADLSCPCKDYARSQVSSLYDGPPLAGAGKMYAPAVRLLSETTAAITSSAKPEQNVLVLHDVTFHAFAAMVQRVGKVHVFTLLAHNRMVDVEAGDIPDVTALLQRIASATDTILRYVRRRMEEDHAAWLNWVAGEGASISAPSQGEVAIYLTELLRPARDFYERGIQPQRACRLGIVAPPPRLTRTFLELSLPTELTAAKVLEFRDGLYTVREFVNAIPSGFEGVLDLSTCNSELIGEVVRRRCRESSVIHNQRASHLFVKLARYKRVIQLLGETREALPYEEAFQRVQSELNE